VDVTNEPEDKSENHPAEVKGSEENQQSPASYSIN